VDKSSSLAFRRQLAHFQTFRQVVYFIYETNCRDPSDQAMIRVFSLIVYLADYKDDRIMLNNIKIYKSLMRISIFYLFYQSFRIQFFFEHLKLTNN